MFARLAKFLLLPLVMLVSLSFWPGDSLAAIDQRCWQKDLCEKSGGTFYGPNPETEGACSMAADLSGNKIGFCLPEYKANTRTDFGGKTEFIHFGEFIQWMYRYGVIAAALLAMAMIVMAGFNWTMSGGSPEKITAAKKRLGNALMGLFIAILSYFILNMINPYLVNFRLPEIWKINEMGLAPVWCADVKDDDKLAFAAKANEEILQKNADTMYKAALFKSKKDTLASKEYTCGTQFFVEGTGGLTCRSEWCEPGWQCMSATADKNEFEKKVMKSGYYCVEGQLIIHFKIVSTIDKILMKIPFAGVPTNILEEDWLDEETSPVDVFYAVCQNNLMTYVNWSGKSDWENKGKHSILDGYDPTEYRVYYPGLTAYGADFWCKNSSDKVLGLILNKELNKDWKAADSDLYIGQKGDTNKPHVSPNLFLTMGDWVNNQTYIKWESLEKGLFMTVELDDKAISSILTYSPPSSAGGVGSAGGTLDTWSPMP
ncbi:MAG TPA: hypothetical protein VJB37_02495 [Patescibacteria group bacterium]|nr:hypothetical protein [Patescibacteria group bacterium]